MFRSYRDTRMQTISENNGLTIARTRDVCKTLMALCNKVENGLNALDHTFTFYDQVLTAFSKFIERDENIVVFCRLSICRFLMTFSLGSNCALTRFLDIVDVYTRFLSTCPLRHLRSYCAHSKSLLRFSTFMPFALCYTALLACST